MLTHAPLPRWPGLLRSLSRTPPPDELLLEPWRRDGDLAGLLSRTAWSLALIAQWRAADGDGLPATLFLPDYFCNDTLVPLREAGVKLVFYPLSDAMAPDVEACEALARVNRPDLFLLVHYFGRPAPAQPAGGFCARHGAWLIEDAAHAILPVDGIGTTGDFVAYSPHKQISIPDGAVLIARGNGVSRIPRGTIVSFGAPRSWPAQLRHLQIRLGSPDSLGRRNASAWLAKRSLQKLGIRRRWRIATPFAESPRIASANLNQLGVAEASALSRGLLGGMAPDFGSESRRRKQAEWDALLLGPSTGLAATERPAGREWTPYLAGYTADPRRVEATHRRLQERGLPVTTWPDLPPEVIANAGGHPNAWRLRHCRIYLPVHESITVPDQLFEGGDPE